MKIKEYLKIYNERRGQTLSGSLSFFFVLSVVPILFLALYLYNYLATKMGLEVNLDQLDFITFDLNAGVSIFFMLTTLLSSSALFYHLRKTGEIIYGKRKQQNKISAKVFSVLAVVVVLCVIILGLFLVLLASSFIEGIFGAVVVKVLTLLVLLMILYLILLVINKYSSPDGISIKQARSGTLFTLIYLVIVSVLFFTYVKYIANYEALYGYLSVIIAFLFLVNLIMQGVVFGIVITYKKMR